MSSRSREGHLGAKDKLSGAAVSMGFSLRLRGFSSFGILRWVLVICSPLPHPRHFGGVRLQVAEILLTNAGLIVDFYRVARERGELGVVAGKKILGCHEWSGVCACIGR